MSASVDETVLSQRSILAGVVGVWRGTYGVYDADGRETERFASRQETRLVDDRWYERVVYERDGQAPEVLDFRARFDDEGRLVFGDDRFEGQLDAFSASVLVFRYRWRADPGSAVVETITLAPPDHKARIWQQLRQGRLVGVTLVTERRLAGVEPAEWW